MKKILVLVCFIGLMLAGCVTTDQKVADLEQKVSKLERQVRNIQMSGATGAGANIYPVTGGLTGGGTGALDKITSVADQDAAIVMLNEHATWGDAFMPYTADDDSGTEAAPYVIDPDEAGTKTWYLTDIYGYFVYGHSKVVSAGTSCTIGVDCDGTLVRVAWGGVIYTTAAITVTLPEISDDATPTAIQVVPGASICIIHDEVDNEQTVVDCNINDSIILDGTKDTAGDSIDSTVAAATGGGDYVCLLAVATDAWMVMGYKGTWTAN